jgi:molybdate transport system substrate-binding protein
MPFLETKRYKLYLSTAESINYNQLSKLCFLILSRARILETSMPKAYMYSFLTAITLILFNSTSFADTIKVAVPVYLNDPVTEIAKDFESKTGHTVNITGGAEFRLVKQVKDGVPYDIFLSDGEKGAQILESEGKTVGGRQTFGRGNLVLWSTLPNLVNKGVKVLSPKQIKHIAITEPKSTEYGAAAMDYLKRKGLQEKLQSLLFFPLNLVQTRQFILGHDAEVGFLSAAQLYRDGKILEGYGYIIPVDQYQPINLEAVLLKQAETNSTAQAFMDYLKSKSSHQVLKKYGYGVE